ncbi:hypothetical protein D3C87_1560860 [compost metagenome]
MANTVSPLSGKVPATCFAALAADSCVEIGCTVSFTFSRYSFQLQPIRLRRGGPSTDSSPSGARATMLSSVARTSPK